MSSGVKSRAGFIYVLRPQVLIDGARIIKIGSTTRTVAERIRELESRSSVMYEALYSVEVEDARSLEKQLHARYASRRMAGGSEGFFHMLPEEVIPEIAKAVADRDRSDLAKARNTEFSNFCRTIDTRRVKASINVASYIIWFLASVLLGFGAIIYAPFDIPRDMESYAIVGSLISSTILVKLGLLTVKSLVKARYFSRRFGPAVDTKNAELRQNIR